MSRISEAIDYLRLQVSQNAEIVSLAFGPREFHTNYITQITNPVLPCMTFTYVISPAIRGAAIFKAMVYIGVYARTADVCDSAVAALSEKYISALGEGATTGSTAIYQIYLDGQASSAEYVKAYNAFESVIPLCLTYG